MSKITKALIWAAIIIGLAVANIFEFVADDTAQTLFIVLPLVAWMSIAGRDFYAPCDRIFGKKNA